MHFKRCSTCVIHQITNLLCAVTRIVHPDNLAALLEGVRVRSDESAVRIRLGNAEGNMLRNLIHPERSFTITSNVHISSVDSKKSFWMLDSNDIAKDILFFLHDSERIVRDELFQFSNDFVHKITSKKFLCCMGLKMRGKCEV